MKFDRTFAAVVALSVLGSGAAWAQTTPSAEGQSPAMEKPSTQSQSMKPAAKEVEGTIKNVDRTKKTVTLDDGTTLAIPASVKVAPNALQKGAKISATYEEQRGQKVVTSLHLQSAPKS